MIAHGYIINTKFRFEILCVSVYNLILLVLPVLLYVLVVLFNPNPTYFAITDA